MANEVDSLSINITAKVNSNQTKLDKLNASLEKLQNIINRDFSQLNDINNKLSSLNGLSTLGDSSKSINRLSKSLERLKSISFAGFSNKMTALTNGIKPLQSLQLGNIGEFAKGLNRLSTSLNKIKNIDTKTVETNVLGLANALKPLTNEMLRGGAVAQSYSNILNRMGRVTTQTAKKSRNWTLGFGKIISSIYLIRRVGMFMGDMVLETAKWTENLNLFANSFGGDKWQEALDWTQNIAQNFGFASNELLKFTGLFKQLATSLGITNEVGTELSQLLTSLALDFSSFYNVDIERTMATFQSAIFGGQTKGARLLFGVEVSYQTLDQILKSNEALSQLGVTSKQLTQEQKALLRSIQFLIAGKNSFGDMQKTINSTMNQIRIFEGATKNLQLALGDLLLTDPFRIMLTNINGLIIGITSVIRAFVGLNTDVNISSKTEEVEGLNEAVKKVNASLFSFDKFEALSSKNNTGIGNLEVTEALVEELKKQKKEYDDIITAMGDINNEAVRIGTSIRDWFIVVEEIDGKAIFKRWSDNATTLFSTIIAITSTAVIHGLSLLTLKLIEATGGMNALNIASNIFRTTGLFLLIFSISKLVLGYKDMNNMQKALYISLGLLGLGITILSNKTLLGLLQKAITRSITGIHLLGESVLFTKLAVIGLGGAFGLLLGGILTQLPTQIRAISGVMLGGTGIVLGFAYALGVLHSTLTLGLATAGIIAGVVALTSAINEAGSVANAFQAEYKADGGTFDTRGGYALGVVDEYGKDELVYSNNARQIEVSNQSSLETSFTNAIYKALPPILNDYCKKNQIEIVDKTDNGVRIREDAPKMHAEMQRLGLL